jgi:hypothetical protein
MCFDIEKLIDCIMPIPSLYYKKESKKKKNEQTKKFDWETLHWRLILYLNVIYIVVIPTVLTYIQANLSPFAVLSAKTNLGISFTNLILLSFPIMLVLAIINYLENRQENRILRNIALFSLFYLLAVIMPFLLSISYIPVLPSSSQLVNMNCAGNNATGYYCINLPNQTILSSLISDLIVIFSIILVVFQIFRDKFTKIPSIDKLNLIFLFLPLLGISLAIAGKAFLIYGTEPKLVITFSDFALFVVFVIFGFAIGLLDNPKEKILVRFDSKQHMYNNDTLDGKIYPYKFDSEYHTYYFYIPKGYKYKIKDIKLVNKNVPDGELLFYKNYSQTQLPMWGTGNLLISSLYNRKGGKINEHEFNEGECLFIQFKSKNKVKLLRFTMIMEFYVKRT